MIGDVVNARSCRSRDASFPTTYHSRPVQHSREFWPVTVHIFCRQEPKCFGKGLSQLPSQKRQRRVTSDHTTWALSTHSTTRPFTPFAADRAASLLCSRKTCDAQSAVRCRRSTPRPCHCRGRFWVVATVLSLVFNLAGPLTQSTLVLQSPWISRISFSLPPEFQVRGEAPLFVSLPVWSHLP